MVKKSACSARDQGVIPGSRRSPGEGNGNPLQYSCLENPMDRGAWWAIVHGVAESDMTEQLTHTHTHTGTLKKNSSYNFSSVESLCCVWLFVIPWTVTCQASLSITNSRSLLKLMSIELVMPSNHLILCRPLLLSPSIFPSIRVFSNESALHIRWPKYWSFSFSISLFNDYWNIRYSLLICKSLEALEHFFEICDNLKKLADKSCSLETTKRKKNLGMLWMHKTYVDTSHPYINWVIFHIKWITCWFSYYFITLVSKNYIPVRMPLSLIIWETAYQLSSQVKGF